MKKKVTLYSQLAVCIAFFFIISSCKEKGCTDVNAFNYSSVAEEDDGSCVYCNDSVLFLDSASCNLIDNDFGSPYFSQIVGIFYLEQIKTQFSNPICGTGSCGILVTFESLVNERMQFTFSLQGNSSVISYSLTRSIDIPGNQRFELGEIPKSNIQNPCSSISNSNPFVSTFGSIVYN